jgi:hypothetical protein
VRDNSNEDQARDLRAHQIEMSLQIGKLKSKAAKKEQAHRLVVSLKDSINSCSAPNAAIVGSKVV